MNSMTGYGRCRMNGSGHEVTVEIRAVNHRFLEVGVKYPRAYGFLEEAVRQFIQGRINRGKVDVFIGLESSSDETVSMQVDHALARRYIVAMRELKKAHKLAGKVDLASVLRYPDVLVSRKTEASRETVWEVVLPALESAVADFEAMRAAEGARLGQDMLQKVDELEAFVDQVDGLAKKVVPQYREKLYQRVRDLLGDAHVDEGRLLTEVALMADKAAIDEELTRLRSHFVQARSLLMETACPGKKMDFLIQEMNREVNTIGSKANDLQITQLVVEMKGLIEKLREQIQNIE